MASPDEGRAPPGAVLEVTRPDALKPVAIRGTASCAIAVINVTCQFGDLEANGGRTVTIDALALRPAVGAVHARLTTSAPSVLPLEAAAAIRVITDKRCELTIPATGGSERGTKGGDRIIGGAWPERADGPGRGRLPAWSRR